MMAGTNTTTAQSTTATRFARPPSTICSGFIDPSGRWNNGFACPIKDLVQYFCCGTDNHHYCCPPDRYLFESSVSADFNSWPDHASQSSHPIPVDQSSLSLIHQQNMISRQFEQFQRYFLPIFLLTTTILFLVGIALWFWLYKHKIFYSLGQDEFIAARTSPPPSSDTSRNRRESINLTLDQQSQFMSHSSTEV